jgi:hypothetical protein
MDYKKTKRTIFIYLVIFEFLVMGLLPMAVSAISICIPCIADEVASQMESRYHMDLGNIQGQSENFNVSLQKTTAPQVSLMFDPSEPKEGQKLSTKATPSFFQNPVEKLYFTWYLKHDSNDNGKHGRTECENKEYSKNCDWNNDGKIDEEDWKIEAMRLVATNGYNNKLDEPLPNYSRDGDSDGYTATIGGDDKKGMPSYCYIHDFNTGTDCEIVSSSSSILCNHLFPDAPSHTTGDGEFKSEEERFWGTNPQDSNTSGNGNLDEANVAGLGQVELNWTYYHGDQVGVAVEGTSLLSTKHDDSSYKIMWALPKNDFNCSDQVGMNDQLTCPSGYTASCTETELSIDSIAIVGGDSTGGTLAGKCMETGNSPACSGGIPVCSSGGIPKCIPNAKLKAANSYYDNTDFDYVDVNNDNKSCQNSNILPAAPDNETNCEALRFSDCNDTPTCEANPSLGTSGGQICNGSYSQTIRGYAVNIPTVSGFNINDCLGDNLIDPAEKKLEKLNVSLLSTPDNPINDSTGSETGDVLSVKAALENASQDPSQLRYEWRIEGYDGGYTSIVKDLVQDKLLEGGNLENNTLVGLGLSSINLKLNLGANYKKYFDNGIGSLKISVTARESNFGSMRIGRSETIVKLVSTDKKINAYLTNSSDGIKLKQGDPICNKMSTPEDKLSYYNCPVIANQIIKLTVNSSALSDFSWKVNDQPFTCNSSVTDECANGNVIFLPTTGNIGQTINVGLTAKDLDKGENIELSKNLEIVDPYVKIVSGNEKTFWKKLLGTYNNLDGSKSSDFSDSIFETYAGANADLKAEFHPSWLSKYSQTNLQWTVDGNDAGSDPEINFAIDKNPGDVYNVGLNSFYNVPNEIRIILRNGWNISQTDSAGKSLNYSIQGEVISEDVAGTVASKNPGKFLASLISNLPSQAIFLLRTVLTIFVVILASGIAMNYSPAVYKNKNKPTYE